MISTITLVVVISTLVSSQKYAVCNVYNQLEATSTCGPNGYALKYGMPNCQRFIDNEWLYNREGKAWLNCTRTCLGSFITNDIIAKNITNCTAINAAFGSHVPCYVNCGFCHAALTNVIPLALTYRVQDFLSPVALQQVLQVSATCIFNPLLFLGR